MAAKIYPKLTYAKRMLGRIVRNPSTVFLNGLTQFSNEFTGELRDVNNGTPLRLTSDYLKEKRYFAIAQALGLKDILSVNFQIEDHAPLAQDIGKELLVAKGIRIAIRDLAGHGIKNGERTCWYIKRNERAKDLKGKVSIQYQPNSGISVKITVNFI